LNVHVLNVGETYKQESLNREQFYGAFPMPTKT